MIKTKKERKKELGRINPDDMEKYGNENSSEWLKLVDNGDVARVQFLYRDYTDLDTFACHRVMVGDKERYVSCKRNYDEPLDACPFCEHGLPVRPVMMLSMYDHEDGKVKIWERGKTFIKKMQALFNRYPDLENHVFEIERHGKKGDNKTTYDIYPMPEVEPMDVSQVERPEFLGNFILDKTPNEMQYYLDTNAFPETSDGKQNDYKEARRNTEPLPRRGAGSGATRRRAGM